MREILAELVTALEQKRDCVFCSLVETRGSTPQKAGATMLVFADGSQRGTLGGGCVEAEVKQRALALLGHGGPEIVTFQLDDNYGWDDGLICGGRMSMLIHPLAANGTRSPADAEAEYFQTYRQLVESGRGCTEAVLLGGKQQTPSPARFLFDHGGRLAGRWPEVADPSPARGQLVPVADRPRA